MKKLIKKLTFSSVEKRRSINAFEISISVSDMGLLLSTSDEKQEVPWSRIDRVVATKYVRYPLGDDLVLVFDIKDGGAFPVMEGSPAWKTIVERLPRHLLGAKEYAYWSLALVAATEPLEVEVFRRDGTESS